MAAMTLKEWEMEWKRTQDMWAEEARRAGTLQAELDLVMPLVFALEDDARHGNLTGRAEDAWASYMSVRAGGVTGQSEKGSSEADRVGRSAGDA